MVGGVRISPEVHSGFLVEDEADYGKRKANLFPVSLTGGGLRKLLI